MQRHDRVGMFAPDRLLLNRQRAPEERLCFAVPRLPIVVKAPADGMTMTGMTNHGKRFRAG